jgi:hypothetical protein
VLVARQVAVQIVAEPRRRHSVAQGLQIAVLAVGLVVAVDRAAAARGIGVVGAVALEPADLAGGIVGKGRSSVGAGDGSRFIVIARHSINRPEKPDQHPAAQCYNHLPINHCTKQFPLCRI